MSFVGFSKSPNLVNLPTIEVMSIKGNEAAVFPEVDLASISKTGNTLDDPEARLFFEVYLEEVAPWMDIIDPVGTVSPRLITS